MGPAILLQERFQQMDYLHPYNFDSVTMVIPKPTVSSLNISAVWKPFQLYVEFQLFKIIVLRVEVKVFF